jgi:D-glycero-D-manno-heptose 1,7-bisphosphate phosphatase
MKPAIFLDRDGTIIVDKNYLNDPNQVEFLPQAVEALKELQTMGYKLIVVTNQSGIARGIVSEENLHKIHRRINEFLLPQGITIDAYYFSPHAADSDHPTRKPNPGMIEQAIKDHKVNRAKSWMIGDRMSDVQAGHNAKMRTVLLSTAQANVTSPEPDLACDTLLDFVEYLRKEEA